MKGFEILTWLWSNHEAVSQESNDSRIKRSPPADTPCTSDKSNSQVAYQQ